MSTQIRMTEQELNEWADRLKQEKKELNEWADRLEKWRAQEQAKQQQQEQQQQQQQQQEKELNEWADRLEKWRAQEQAKQQQQEQQQQQQKQQERNNLYYYLIKIRNLYNEYESNIDDSYISTNIIALKDLLNPKKTEPTTNEKLIAQMKSLLKTIKNRIGRLSVNFVINSVERIKIYTHLFATIALYLHKLDPDNYSFIDSIDKILNRLATLYKLGKSIPVLAQLLPRSDHQGGWGGFSSGKNKKKTFRHKDTKKRRRTNRR